MAGTRNGTTARLAGRLGAVAFPAGDIADRGLRYLIAAGVGAVLLVSTLITVAYLGTRLPFGTLVAASLAAALPVPICAALILWLDRHEKEPVTLLGAAFLWGAVVATLISLVMNTGAHVVLRALFGPAWAGAVTPAVVAPIVEETSKGLALLLLLVLARGEFNNLVDGIVYGALVGLGFEMVA